MAKAAIYARYSSDNQREESIEAQEKAMQDYAAKNNIIIVEKYFDRAESGREDNRPALQQMLKDAGKGLFDTVLVHKIDRFGRNKIQIALNRHTLKQHGVNLISVAEDFGTGPHSVIMESIMEGLAEFYSLNLAQETMKGLMVNAEKCLYNGGHVLYGYRVNEDKKYEIEPKEAEIVQEIFQRVRDGWSYARIIDDLNSRNIKRRGSPWGKNTLHEMLKNERYSGVYLFNQTPKKVNDKRNSRIKKPESEIVRIEGGIPQIVNRALWLEVQEITGQRKQAPRKTNNNYLLTGLVECGECGSAYVGSNSYLKGREITWYICSGRKSKRNCENKGVRQGKLEQYVVDYLIYITEGFDIEEATMEFNAMLKSQRYDEREAEITIELAVIDKKVDKLLDAIEEGGEFVKDRLKEYVSKKRELDIELEKIRAKSAIQCVTPEQIQSALKYLDPRQATTPEELREVLSRLVNKVIIKESQIEVRSNWDSDNHGVGRGT